MSEFCVDCWNKLNETNDSKWRYALTYRKELCEECEQYKRVIVTERRWSRMQRMFSEAVENMKSRKENR